MNDGPDRDCENPAGRVHSTVVLLGASVVSVVQALTHGPRERPVSRPRSSSGRKIEKTVQKFIISLKFSLFWKVRVCFVRTFDWADFSVSNLL
jgi:hypothetical protein